VLPIVHSIGWSLIFIDGDHKSPSRRRDCARLVENDVLILFHHLVSPDVAKGLGAAM
jgi:hypothetical protein